LFKSPVADVLSALARMERPSSLPISNDVAGALFVSIPPYPTERTPPQEGIPIRGFTKADRPHLYFYDVQLDERLHVVTTPAYGAVVTITGTGESSVEALQGVMEIAKRAKIIQVFVRARAELEPYLYTKEVDLALDTTSIASVAAHAD